MKARSCREVKRSDGIQRSGIDASGQIVKLVTVILIRNDDMEEETKTGIDPEQASATDLPEGADGKSPGIFEKKEIRIALAALALLVAAFLAWNALQPKFIAARVNGTVISRAEVTRELERQAGAQVLESLISDRLVQDDADSKGITVVQEDIDREVANLTSQLETQGQSLDAYLASQNFTREYLSERIRLRLLLDELLADRIAVTDEEVEAFIEQNGDFLPEGTDTTDPEFRAQIAAQLEQEKFNAAAGSYIDELLSSSDVQYVHSY